MCIRDRKWMQGGQLWWGGWGRAWHYSSRQCRLSGFYGSRLQACSRHCRDVKGGSTKGGSIKGGNTTSHRRVWTFHILILHFYFYFGNSSNIIWKVNLFKPLKWMQGGDWGYLLRLWVLPLWIHNWWHRPRLLQMWSGNVHACKRKESKRTFLILIPYFYF